MSPINTGSSQTCGSSASGSSSSTVFPPVFDREHVEQLHRRPVALLRRLLDRGLEVPAEVEHEIGVEQLVDLLRSELEVVRLRARGREVRHLHAVAAHPLGGVRKG